MVEGPGCTNNGRKVASIIGFKLLHVNVIQNTQPERTINTLIMEPTRDKEHTYSFIIRQVLTIGKELFIIFTKDDKDYDTIEQDLALRLHFGMNGSLIMTKDDASTSSTTFSNQKYKDNSMKTLEMIFVNPKDRNQITTTMRAYQTTISNIIQAKAPRMKYERMKYRDLCSSEFNIQIVLQDLSNESSSSFKDDYISDIVLNQNILPGVGNIIKIEGLHDARIHPKRTLKSLTRDELYNVIMSCRTYAMIWLRNGRSPPKRVYNQTLCGTCAQNSIAIEKVGNTDRTTFWCKYCQKLDSENSSLDDLQVNLQNNNGSSVDSTPSTVSYKTPKIRKVCSLHGPEPVVLRRCRKGINQQRIFYSCKIKNCKYFCWADGSFPLCKCGKRTLMRISKTEHSGGKWFFVCAQNGADRGKRSACGYFQWVEQEFLDRTFGQLLTPLL